LGEGRLGELGEGRELSKTGKILEKMTNQCNMPKQYN
jgi:hypothetical protein